MTEEEKAATAKAEAEKAEKEKADAESKAKKDDIDYKAVAEAEKERREAAEKLLAEDRYNQSKAKREEDGDPDEDTPLTKKDLQQVETRLSQNLQKVSQETVALQIARANTSTEDEAQAAIVFYKNRVVPTGNLEEDIKFAIGGLNYKKVVAKNNELSRALKGKDSESNDPTTTHQDGMPKTEPKLPDNSPLKEYTYAGNGIYTKKLANGKTLYRNSKPAPGQPKSWVV